MKNLFLLIVCIGLAWGYMAVQDAANNAPNESVKSAPVQTAHELASLQSVPDFTWMDLNDRPQAFSDLRGKTVILNFWATWCAPCVVEFPAMLTLANDRPDVQFVFLSVDADKESVHRFLKKYAPNGLSENARIGWDPQQKITQGLFGTLRLPESYIITPQGKIARKIIGSDIDWNGAEIKKELTKP